jgi:hypothetical protein
MPYDIHKRVEPLRPRESIRRRAMHTHNPETSVRLSSEELTHLLRLDGATIVSFRDYGVLLQAHHHLIFVRRAAVVDNEDLLDVLDAAGIGPGRFDRLLEAIRLEPIHVR